MSSYERVRGWSEMIREVVATRQMPPWQADPHIGTFSNDFSMKPEEARTLIQWIDAGCPRGEGEDPLREGAPNVPAWHLGPPDHVVEIPEQSVPAEGVLDYRYVTVDSPIEQDAWLRAVEIVPGNTQVLHHIIATTRPPGAKDRKEETFLAGYAPGMGPDRFPEGTGIRLKAGSKIVFQLHYTASGRAETDRSRLGLYVSETPPEKEYRSRVVIDSKFRIPAGAREHTATKSHRFNRDIVLYSMNPHMHLRGKWMRYTARYPDGSEEVLLSVPNYHFDWQRNYMLAEPKRLPRGTELIVDAAWDNSALNPHNPDPTQEVGWGEQTFDEMFYASYRFTHADAAADNAQAAPAAASSPQPSN